jgi:5-formyltetrahydrofolate cyclo-ligase
VSDHKPALRKAARTRRRALAAEIPHAAEQAAAALAAALDTGELGPFRHAALYIPHGAELDPRPLGAALVAAGAQLCLPAVIHPDTPLAFQEWSAGDDLAPDALGLFAPVRTALCVAPDLIVLPLLAFDAAGGRLGQGGGYFDRTLEALRAKGRVFAMGLAYAGQEVRLLPAEAHDQPLDAVLTEQGLRRFGASCA